ncbi:MAG: tetratricopeptide repeat protein [Anaerolineales bacterium]|nr:tetratricopeptide repeat protein [Anaerolineales bacterium]
MYLQGRSLKLRRKGRRSDPRRVLLLIMLIGAGLLLVSLRHQGVVRPLFEATAAPTRFPETYANEGQAWFAAGKLKEAIAAYDQATRADPKNLDYWVAKSRIEIYAEKYEDALASAEWAVLVAPNDAKSKTALAWALDWNVVWGCRCKNLSEAEAAIVTAVALDSNYAPAHAVYSEILNDGQKWTQAFQEAETALRLDPNLLESHRAMAYSYENIGQYEDAIASYKNALKFNPNLIGLYISLGLNYRVLGDIDQAIFYFSKASAIDPQNVQPYLYLSRTHYQNDELGTAVQYLEQALNLEPADPDIHGRLGLIFFKRRNYEGALPELALAVLGGTVDAQGNPLTLASGVPVLDVNGTPVAAPTNSPVLQVPPKPLNDAASLEYYYTYGNLLAYLKKCAPNEAPRFLQLALNYDPDNPTVLGSYEESMAICNGELTVDEAQNGTATPEGGPTTTRPAPVATEPPSTEPPATEAPVNDAPTTEAPATETPPEAEITPTP